MHKLTSLFKRDKENGHIPVRPACFADSPERRRSESPEPAGMGRRKNGAAAAASGGKKTWKTEGGKDALGVGWRPKVSTLRFDRCHNLSSYVAIIWLLVVS